ncbi:glycogen debranching protein GlgX [Massilia sp. TS11]|uniref:glycogen debranching protein GlgX n=1 Tax=Massilia sp. TS11 TaxID=2908003 RepID=UPI001EDAECAB|nr:glycogen debranching protein GlgX [Massilia sp. TS11]MCG2583739.1 glycogen debranching protein GlgX [Massilia sp. TS11]
MGKRPAAALAVTGVQAYPLGALPAAGGVNFALVAPHAERVDLCLFDGDQETRLTLPCCSNGVWHGHVAGIGPGQLYGYRVHGPFAPQRGLRFNPNKLLLDPYAREVVGRYLGQESFRAHLASDPDQPDPVDNGREALKGRVVAEDFDWGDDRPPRIPIERSVLYEVHLKGLSARHPQLAPAVRGSYAALAEAPVLDHLQALGVTAVSLLPLHARADEPRLLELGLSNYWGYNTVGFFAPEPRYWSGRPGTSAASELKSAIRALHARGIEVLLDVVYNHTAEGDERGPTFSLRGIDNALYYHLKPCAPAYYENWTGCGNTLNLEQPRVLQLVLDSLRYWVEHYHVDGFRFDLAPALARTSAGFQRHGAFLSAVAQDPVLARVKLIAEPWDIGPGGYQVGNFQPGWCEWNDQYRDTMRAFWLGHPSSLGEFARRFSASSDLFRRDGRAPSASVNFISAHDGFTLRDLVSYNEKHNLPNGEDNRDGHNHNRSNNCGVEGPSTDLHVLRLRARLQRALLATLIFSQGTPMLLGGDELGHTQNGNNNAYCQDNVTTWLDWEQADRGLLAFVASLITLRQRYPALRHTLWFTGAAGCARDADIVWLGEQAQPLTEHDWQHGRRRIAIRLGGAEPCLLLINAEAADTRFSLPPGQWTALLDTSDPHAGARGLGAEADVPAHALVLAVQHERKDS